jgi:2Fe-2S ferredoxin
MPKIRFIEHGGREHVIDASVSASVMQAAIDNSVPGIIADCGGTCACATCHGYIETPWSDRLPLMEERESWMLDGSPHRRPTSRLTCQIRMSDELDGIVVRLPASQY